MSRSKLDIELLISQSERIESTEQQILDFAETPLYGDIRKMFRRELFNKFVNILGLKEHGDVIADQAEAALFLEYQDNGIIENLLRLKAQDKEEENE